MSDIKYTNDGKKVVIIGKLNSQETIVQEIYVVNGREIPSGEHFVVKSLHDQPCESWKSYEQKTREYLEKKLKKENEQFDNEIKQLNREHRKLCNVMRKKTKFMKSVVEKFNNSTLNSVLDFLSGKIKYIVKSDYGRFEILGLNTAIAPDSNNSVDDIIKLITLFGRSDGSLQFRINKWSDGSGGNTAIYPFKTHQECIEFVSQKLNELAEYNSSTIETANKYGIKLKADLLKKYWEKELKSHLSRLAEIEKALENVKKKVTEIEKQIEQINN